MKHYSYYAGGVLQEEVGSKTIAKLLLNGELDSHERVLDLQTGMWVPVARQADIMSIYRSMREASTKPSFFELYMGESTSDNWESMYDPVAPDRTILGFIPIWSAQQMFISEYWFFRFLGRVFHAYKKWRQQD